MSFPTWCGRSLAPLFPGLFLLISIQISIPAAERWKIQYSYTKTDSSLEIRDIQCPSPERCIAVGLVGYKDGHNKGVVLLTADAGRNWSLADVHERPISLFFLNDSLGWMVTDRGVWSTNESGRGWKKLEVLKKGMIRAHFLDPTHGFVIGYPKAIHQTADGGKTWAKLAAADTPATEAEDTVYECISFRGPHGVITGRIGALREDQEPAWVHPETSSLRAQRRSTVVILETWDGGKTWKSSTPTAFGNITQARIAPDDSLMALFQYRDYFTVPSSVVKLNLASNTTRTLFSERDRAVTDFALLSGGAAILAAVEPPGNSNQVPIPGKLKMLKSNNLKLWMEMDVDYRAVAQHVMLAAPDARHIWAATDTGMILHLIDTPTSSR